MTYSGITQISLVFVIPVLVVIVIIFVVGLKEDRIVGVAAALLFDGWLSLRKQRIVRARKRRVGVDVTDYKNNGLA